MFITASWCSTDCLGRFWFNSCPKAAPKTTQPPPQFRAALAQRQRSRSTTSRLGFDSQCSQKISNQGKCCWDKMTAAQLRWWTVPRLNNHLNPSSTGESRTAKKKYWSLVHDNFPVIKSILIKISWTALKDFEWRGAARCGRAGGTQRVVPQHLAKLP